MSKEEQLRQQIEKLTRERDAYAQSLATSNQAFMEKVKEFSIIKRLADSLLLGMNRRQICSEIVDIIIDETTAENCSLWLLDKPGHVLSLIAVRGQEEGHTRYLEEGEGQTLPVGKGAAGWVAERGESLLIENVASSPYFIPTETHTSIRSLLCLPIKGNGQVIGVLNLSHPDIGVFSAENERVLQLITDQAGIGLTNNHLFEEIQEFNRNLERKVVERTRHVKRSEERYQRAINAGKVGIWDWQVGSPVVYVASNLKVMLGFSATAEMRDLRVWLKLVHPKQRKQFLRYMIRQVKGETIIYEGELRMRHKDGRWLWFFVRAATVRGKQGRPGRIYGSNTDITKRKEAELELVRAQEEALVNAHAAGKAEFATTVLHNIGNVLNSVNVDSLHIRKTLEGMRLQQMVMACKLLVEHRANLADYLINDERGSRLPEYLARVSAVVARDAGSLSRLSDDIAAKVDLMRDIIETQQSYATTTQGALPYDIKRLAEEALKVQMDSIRRRGVSLHQNFSEVPQVVVNSSKLIHVMINMLKNAVEAMEAVPENRRELTLTIKAARGRVILSIADTGMGIAPENLPKMFTYGFSTKKTGHGFGLHYCARTIEAMGGEVRVESAGVNKGATFIISFPAAPSKKRRHQPTTAKTNIVKVVPPQDVPAKLPENPAP